MKEDKLTPADAAVSCRGSIDGLAETRPHGGLAGVVARLRLQAQAITIRSD